MGSVYEQLIDELKIHVNNKRKFSEILRLINEPHDLDEPTCTLLIKISEERERIGQRMESKLNNLIWMNERLVQFGEEPQCTLTKARTLLKTIFINIYDLESENYERRTTKLLLQKSLRKHPEKRYPLCSAKDHISLKCFLIKL